MSNVSTFYGQIQNLVFDVLNFEKIAGKGPPPMAMPIPPPPPPRNSAVPSFKESWNRPCY